MKLKIKVTPECTVPHQIYCEAVELFENHIQKYLQERANLSGPNFYAETFPNDNAPDILEIRYQNPLKIDNLPSYRIGKNQPAGGNGYLFEDAHRRQSQQKKKFQIRKKSDQQKDEYISLLTIIGNGTLQIY